LDLALVAAIALIVALTLGGAGVVAYFIWRDSR
jgi:hypothetical protein